MGGLVIDIDDLTEEQAKNLLSQLVSKLDELDDEDFFGTEGWRHFFGIDEE
jgi:hypothetical protein